MWYVTVGVAGVSLVLEEAGLPLCLCGFLGGERPSPSGRRLHIFPEPTPVLFLLYGNGWSLLWAILLYTESSKCLLNQWITPYKNLHLFNIIINDPCEIIQKVLMYVSHSVLSIYPFVIHSTNILCTPTRCQALYQPLGIRREQYGRFQSSQTWHSSPARQTINEQQISNVS